MDTKSQVIKLRPHHLLCILTYVGEGYSDSFNENFSRVLKAIMSGISVRIVEGPDEICNGKSCMTDPRDNCLSDDIKGRDKKSISDLQKIHGLSLAYGVEVKITEDIVRNLRRSFQVGTIRNACQNCMWQGLCTDVAVRYDKVQLFPPQKGIS